MKQPKKNAPRVELLYIDEDKARFEARLHKNAKTEPHVPPMKANKGKRTRFTGLTTKGAVAALKKIRAKETK
jgi:hypothetical protein